MFLGIGETIDSFIFIFYFGQGFLLFIYLFIYLFLSFFISLFISLFIM